MDFANTVYRTFTTAFIPLVWKKYPFIWNKLLFFELTYITDIIFTAV